MAQNKRKKKIKPTKEDGLSVFLKSPRFAIVRGVFYLLFSLFSFVAIVSYVFLYVGGGSEPLASDNLCGSVGGGLARMLVSRSFGIASMGLCFLLFVYGLRLFVKNRETKSEEAPRRTLWYDDTLFRKTLWSTLFWVLWLASTIGWIANPNDSTQSTVGSTLAGVVGTEIACLLYKWLNIGLPILLLFLAFAFFFLVHHISIPLPKRNVDAKAVPQPLTKDDGEEHKGFFARLFHRSGHDDDGETDDDGAEFQPDSHFDDLIMVGSKATPADTDSPSGEPVENGGKITFDIDDEFARVNKVAQGANKGDDPIFTVNQVDETDTEFVDESEDDESDPDDYRMHYGVDVPFDPKLDLKDFKMPDTDLLEDWEQKNVKVTNEELVANKDRIVATLRNYGIEIVEITASPGPTVTLYEIKPAPGIRISKIKSLEDDIALSLAALGIRIIAPIPGRGTIGIEVPNANPQIVSMKTMLNSDAFKNSKGELPIAFGKTISNDVFVTDLAKMPHLLMAGATGTGKSVGLNAVIASLLYKKHPAELKFVMVDPKKVELSLYNAIERHYLAKLPDSEEAIITDVKKVVRTLNSLCIEMDQRYDLLKAAQCRNIIEYNEKFKSRHLLPTEGHRYLPYIVLVVDEFADLIMTAGRDVEAPIARLAQLARAIGIHLIIATQRPSVNIITGSIKANFPARIAFRVISAVDSKTILDQSGANQLIGRGDMLLSTGNDMVRLQCAFIDTPEVEAITSFIGEQRGFSEPFLLPEVPDEEGNGDGGDFEDGDERDSLFEEAARIVVQTQQGSTSMIQRKLKLGYNRAGRIIDQLEAAGIVGPFSGSKSREVKVANEFALEQILKDIELKDQGI